MSLDYVHVDVFSTRPYGGNSLAVFTNASGLSSGQMQAITTEMRHFESIFLEPDGSKRSYKARVFDLIEELDFAGHPLIGAACVLHANTGSGPVERWSFSLHARNVTVETKRRDDGYFAVLDQGAADFLGEPPSMMRGELASWFSLNEQDLDGYLPPQVVSTGLRYLVLPVRGDALGRARISAADLEAKLAVLGAQFAYLLDAEALEGRHWNNDGVVEDVATGSGAGCAAAYLRRHDRISDGQTATLKQGRFVGRPSELAIRAWGSGAQITSVEVGGAVAMVGRGTLDALPERLR